MLRDWLGYLSLTDDDRRLEAADEIAGKVAEALELRTSSFRVDIPSRQRNGHDIEFHPYRMRTRFAGGLSAGVDPWNELFAMAVAQGSANDGEMVPYWVFHEGPAKIERHVPVMPFSRDEAVLPKLRKTLAAYRLAFGQPRQEELVEFLGADRSDEDLLRLASRLRIDLSPPE